MQLYARESIDIVWFCAILCSIGTCDFFDGFLELATLQRTAISLAAFLGRSRVDGILHGRALVDAGLAEPGRPGSFGGNKSPATTPRQAVLLALSMSSGVLPKAATREAKQFYELPLVSAYRAFQSDAGIQSVPIEDIEAVQGAQFGDVLSAIIGSYCLGIDPSGLRPGLQFAGCMYGVAPDAAFASLDWRAAAPDADGYWVSDRFQFLKPAAVVPSAAISRQIFIPADVFIHLARILREGSGGGGAVDVSERATEVNNGESDFEIAAAPGEIAPGSAIFH
jgi:hypothetical protein